MGPRRLRTTGLGVLYCNAVHDFTAGNGDDDRHVLWVHDGIIFAVGRTCYKPRIRIQADDIDTYDVIIESARETDQGLYRCQTLPHGFQATTYLWVDGNLQSTI